MLTFKNLTIKNFMSFGNVVQSIGLDSSQLSLVLGENLDVIAESGGSRNGVGKSSILNAICFALYGEPISSIKMDNLINLTNEKNMEVSLSFEKMGIHYRIERGRKPNYFRFIVNNNILSNNDGKNVAQGDPKETQAEILKVIGISCELFKQIISLNTLSLPFLSQRSGEQRDLIEELLRISELSCKAENLKENLKTTRDMILTEEVKIKSIKESNEKVQRTVEDLKKRNTQWTSKQKETIVKLESEIGLLLDLEDVDVEIARHNSYSSFKLLNASLSKLTRDKNQKTSLLHDLEKRKHQYLDNITTIDDNKCPTCNQPVNDDNHKGIKESVTIKLNEVESKITSMQQDISTLEKEISKTESDISNLGEIIKPFYDKIDDAYSHKSKLESMGERLQILLDEQNPYDSQMITQQESLLQVIDADYLQQLNILREHQEFLHKLLTNKDSAVRKKIIEQNLSYLNNRLRYYIEKLGLPHCVLFQNDLSTLITEHGRELDFGNLSRGESTRLILGLSFAFRDVFESVETPINLLYIDEICDNGIDQAGLENTLKLLKIMNRDQNRSVFIVSHREELVPRVDNIIMVQKENGFSSIVFGNDEGDAINDTK